MTASIAWLDVSAEQQRRVRDIIRMFEEPGTRDELGIGPVRDAFSEQLFPGTSVIQTRARYFLFVPWAFKEAARRHRGQMLLQRVDRNERQLIERFRNAGFVDGLIGRQAGARVKTLPSTIYWNGLDRLGVLATSMTPRAVAQLAGPSVDEEDELEFRSGNPWHPTLPDPPPGFPNEHSGGFELTRTEAEWLKERIVVRADGTFVRPLGRRPTARGRGRALARAVRSRGVLRTDSSRIAGTPSRSLRLLPARRCDHPRARPSEVATSVLVRLADGRGRGMRGAVITRGCEGVNVDFRAARRQIERHTEFPASTRRQALAAYVGLFDLADEDGRLEVHSALLAASLATSRTSWLSFREVLAVAGLLSVGPRRRGQPIVLHLLPPAD